MPTAKKASVREKEYNIVVNDKVRSYADEPFFIKKEEKSEGFCVNIPYQNI